MKYQIIGKNITVTDAISNAIQNKLSRLEKQFRGKDDIDCRAVVSSHGDTARIEVTIFLSQMPIRAEVEHEDLYAALDLAIDKLESQLRKIKTRMDRSNGKMSLGRAIDFEAIEKIEDDTPDVIVRTKSYYLTGMSIEEAVTRMEALGHDFFLYLDKEDDRISVVYIRRDGGYGVIQAENPIK
jgi:putative sigma-54 modulation protein